MARPRKEGMSYFPHDTDATNDKKIEALRMLYGNDGYAFYFILLEMIYLEPSFELDVSDAETIQILCKKVGINSELFNQILSTALKRDCFDKESYYERHVLTSNGVKKRAAVVVEKREKMRKSYHEKVSDAETPPETPQSKVKEKESKSKVKAVIKDSPQFVEFWNMYPRKVGNADALSAWNNAIKRGAIASDIFKAVENYKINIQTAGTETQFIKHPASFLNKDRWKEYLTQLTVVHGGKQSTTSKLQDLFNRAKEEEEKLEANGGY